MAIKFEDKKSGEAAPAAARNRAVAKPTVPAEIDESGPAPSELPFAKAVRPEKKRKSLQAKKPAR